MKRTLAIALAAVLALSLTLSACNNQPGAASPPSGGGTTSTLAQMAVLAAGLPTRWPAL